MEYIVRPKQQYKEKIVPAMMEEFGYKSVMQVLNYLKSLYHKV